MDTEAVKRHFVPDEETLQRWKMLAPALAILMMFAGAGLALVIWPMNAHSPEVARALMWSAAAAKHADGAQAPAPRERPLVTPLKGGDSTTMVRPAAETPPPDDEGDAP